MKLLSLLYIVANGVGWVFYVIFLEHVSRGMRGEDRTTPDFGDSLYLWETALPLVASLLVVNLVWGGLAMYRLFPCRDHIARASWIGVVTVWGVVYLVMYYRP